MINVCLILQWITTVYVCRGQIYVSGTLWWLCVLSSSMRLWGKMRCPLCLLRASDEVLNCSIATPREFQCSVRHNVTCFGRKYTETIISTVAPVLWALFKPSDICFVCVPTGILVMVCILLTGWSQLNEYAGWLPGLTHVGLACFLGLSVFWKLLPDIRVLLSLLIPLCLWDILNNDDVKTVQWVHILHCDCLCMAM